jgi:hypothetical protein
MAYYTDNLKKPKTEYTARRDISYYRDTIIFREHVYSWLNQRNIEYTWKGHGTSVTEHSSTMHLTVSIPNEHDAMFFMLAWG